MVRRATSPERQAAIGRPLAVDDDVPAVGERRAIGESERRPLLVAQWFGGDHQRVDRDQVAVMVGELGGVGLGRQNDHVGAYDAAGRRDAVGIDALDGRALEEPNPAPSRGGGDAVCQPRRMDDRAMGCEQRSADVGRGARTARLVGVEPPVVIGAEPMLRVLGELGPDAVDLRRRSGEIDPPTLHVVTVDRLGGDDAVRPRRRSRASSVGGRSPRRVRGGGRRSTGSSGAVPSTIRRCGRSPRTPPSPARAPRSATSDPPPRGSSSSTLR